MMPLTIMLKKTDIQRAAKAFDSNRYPLDFYSNRLAILKDARKADAQVRSAIRDLFTWRVGKVRNSKLMPQYGDTSRVTTFADEEGNPYYASALNSMVERSLQKATSKDLLNMALAFRDGDLDYPEFSVEARKIVGTSIFLACFYIHTWRPGGFPLFEKKTWLFCAAQDPGAFPYTAAPSAIKRYDEYIDWFNRLVARTKIDRWTAQIGLWELGRRAARQEKVA